MHVVITGASRGIGQGLAQAYAASGHEVSATARNPGADLVQLDVTDPDQHAAFARGLGDRPVDLLICNAAIYPDKVQDLQTGYGPDLWARTFATNVTGVFLTVQNLLPALERAKTPKIAIISSIMGSDTHATGGKYIYRASKAAVLNLGRNLATDLEARGIAVGIYHPGWVRTDMGGESGAISVEDSVRGLTARFEALSLASSGIFEDWSGQRLDF